MKSLLNLQSGPRLPAAPRWRLGEFLVERCIAASGMLSILVVLAILTFLIKEAWPALAKEGLPRLLGGREWRPISAPAQFGMLPLILGSLLVTAGAALLALPLGVACAVYLAEVARPTAREILKPMVELLAAIPSVVIGFIGLLVLAPLVRAAFHLPTGLTALTGSVMLALMALPTVVSLAEDAVTAVPQEYRAGSLALGATKWQTICRVTVPAARSGIIAALMLGIGRAVGETMTVMMVTGNAAVIPHSILQPVRTMTATIAAEMGETVHYSPHYHALFMLGAVLFLLTFIVNIIADAALRRGRLQQ